jgi:signal transduction histidine kinase
MQDEQPVVRLAVTDTGIGLTPEESAKLFQEFVRIRNEHTLKILGSGLGLSTVRKLARLYGGDVTVASTPGQGSTFTVMLNLKPKGDPHGQSTRD